MPSRKMGTPLAPESARQHSICIIVNTWGGETMAAHAFSFSKEGFWTFFCQRQAAFDVTTRLLQRAHAVRCALEREETTSWSFLATKTKVGGLR